MHRDNRHLADLLGVVYRNIGVVPNREVTVSMNVANIPVTVDATTAQCGFDVTKSPITAEMTTADTIFTAETDSGAPVMVDGWSGICPQRLTCCLEWVLLLRPG